MEMLLALDLPITVFFCQAYKTILIEVIKEHPLYRRLFIIGRRGESSRFGGLYSYIRKDNTEFFHRNCKRIWYSQDSRIYSGKTYFEQDVAIGGRHLCSSTETHHITIANTGGGKSRDAIWNTLLSYAGGCFIFDPKAEHANVTAERRARKRPVYIIDPYGISKIKDPSSRKATAYWNPLSEINPNSPQAREQLRTIAEASIYIEKSENANSSHFRENAQTILRGFMAYVLTDPSIDKEDRNLLTVYNLIKTGSPDAENYSPKAMKEFIETKMTTNTAIRGAARDAADILLRVSEKESGGYLSTISRGIDWINSENVSEIISKNGNFSLTDAKTKEASIYLIMPDEFISQNSRFIATFFSLALDLCGNTITPQPEGSERRVLCIFDEFVKLGHFKPVAEKITIARSAHLKFWLILQNYGQLVDKYENPEDFTGSSDMQFFAIPPSDHRTLKFISDSLGSYTEHSSEGSSTFDILSQSEIAEVLDAKSNGQIIIPISGKPLLLKRVPFYKNYKKSEYGERQSNWNATTKTQVHFLMNNPSPEYKETIPHFDTR